MKIFFSLFLITWSFSARATLGEGPSTVEGDRAALAAEMSNPKAEKLAGGCMVYTMQAHGYSVKEYVGTDNVVFAVSWRGMNHPDLKSLLGNYHAEFSGQEAKRPKGRRYPRQPIQTSKITVNRGGHVGDLRGSAYLTGKLPAGLNEEDLQ